MRLDLSGTSFTSGEMELYLRTFATEQDTVIKFNTNLKYFLRYDHFNIVYYLTYLFGTT